MGRTGEFGVFVARAYNLHRHRGYSNDPFFLSEYNINQTAHSFEFTRDTHSDQQKRWGTQKKRTVCCSEALLCNENGM